MRANGNREAWRKGNDAHVFPDGRYRSCWYDVGDERGSLAAIGIHGQWIWIDPVSRIVLAKMSSRPAPSDDAATAAEAAISWPGGTRILEWRALRSRRHDANATHRINS